MQLGLVSVLKHEKQNLKSLEEKTFLQSSNYVQQSEFKAHDSSLSFPFLISDHFEEHESWSVEL